MVWAPLEPRRIERTKGTDNAGERGGGSNIDHLSAYVIMAGNPPFHTGSGSKQTHVVNSESMGSRSKYCIISINKHCLTMTN